MRWRGVTWDLAVVGAGPAGAATALAALAERPGSSVLLIDRTGFPRDKTCGDGVAPHVLDVLAPYGLAGLVDDWAPVHRLRLDMGHVGVSRTMRRPARVVPREVLDARIVDAALEAGAELRRHRVRTAVPTADGVLLDDTVSARVVVGADGAHSVVRAAAGVAPARRTALAIRGYAPTPPDRRGAQVMVFGEQRQPSYAWSFDRGDGLANVGYGEVLRDDAHRPAPTRSLMIDQLERLLPGSTARGESWRAHHLPLSSPGVRQPDGRLLLTGDAANLVNPMTGEGIYYAVATGVLAGRSAARAIDLREDGEAGRLHRRGMRRLLSSHLRHVALAARLSSTPRALEAGIGAAAADQRVFDDLVEIGLGSGRITPRVLTGLGLAMLGRRGDDARGEERGPFRVG